jgi:predicted ATPase
MIHKPNFHVLTGGPGVGKTTVLRELERRGERVVEENARAVIREQTAGGLARDNDRFVQLTAERDIATFDALAGETRRVFFDRGIFDSYGANGTTPPPWLVEAVRTRRYNAHVFVFPPWREIYATDDERKQDWAAAEATFDLVLGTLLQLGYQSVVVPTGTVEARADFILERASPVSR